MRRYRPLPPLREFVWTLPSILRGLLRQHRKLYVESGRLLVELQDTVPWSSSPTGHFQGKQVHFSCPDFIAQLTQHPVSS